MSEHALHFVTRRGVWEVAGGEFPPLPMVFAFLAFSSFFGLSAQSRTVMMILIPLPSGGATGAGGGGQVPPI